MWISTINSKQTIGLLGRQSCQSYRRDIPTTIFLYGKGGDLCFKMHSLLPFDKFNKTKGSITDCDIICDKSNTLSGDHMPYPFWESRENLASPEILNGSPAFYPSARMKPKISVYFKQIRECPGITLIPSPIKLRG